MNDNLEKIKREILNIKDDDSYIIFFWNDGDNAYAINKCDDIQFMGTLEILKHLHFKGMEKKINEQRN